jgi:putative tricarboxylic transport membrane protein
MTGWPRIIGGFINEETPMRRDTFLKSMAVLAAASSLPLTARAAANIKMMIPANPGGGWDGMGRELGKALVASKLVDTVQYENKGGAGGVIGLAQFINSAKGDPNALLVTGAVMVGGIITGKPAVSMSQVTPIARLTAEYNVFVVPADSPLKTMKDVVAQMQKDPGSVKWGGGSRGSTEHICASMLATKTGVDPKKVNYVAFRGGGEATAAILGGNVTVGGSGYSEFAEYIKAGKMRPIAVTSEKRLPGINIPTMKEQGYDVVLGNWRGVYGGPGITAAQRETLTQMVIKATQTDSWKQSIAKNAWTPVLLTGKAFDDYVDNEFSSLRGIMHLSGMV